MTSGLGPVPFTAHPTSTGYDNHDLTWPNWFLPYHLQVKHRVGLDSQSILFMSELLGKVEMRLYVLALTFNHACTERSDVSVHVLKSNLRRAFRLGSVERPSQRHAEAVTLIHRCT